MYGELGYAHIKLIIWSHVSVSLLKYLLAFTDASVYNVISPPLQSNVFMYYGLSNFYQNHRRYVKSRDDSQLNGDRSALMVQS